MASLKSPPHVAMTFIHRVATLKRAMTKYRKNHRLGKLASHRLFLDSAKNAYRRDTWYGAATYNATCAEMTGNPQEGNFLLEMLQFPSDLVNLIEHGLYGFWTTCGYDPFEVCDL